MMSTFRKEQSIIILIALSLCGAKVREAASQDFNDSRATFQLPPPSPPKISVADVNSVSYGICTHGWITMAAQTCESRFFRSLIEEPYTSSCPSLFKTMQMCINSKWKFCFPNDTFSAAKTPGLESVSLNVYSESAYCNDGALSLPNSNYPINYCSPEYTKEAARCLHEYHNLFRRNERDDVLCEEFLKARECWYNIQDDLCEYEAMLKVLMDAMRQLYRCWNPFCVWPKIGERASFSGKLPIDRSSVPDGYKDTRQGIPKDCRTNAASTILLMSDEAMQSSSDMYMSNDGTTRKQKDLKSNLRLNVKKQLKLPSRKSSEKPDAQGASAPGKAPRHFHSSRMRNCVLLLATFLVRLF